MYNACQVNETLDSSPEPLLRTPVSVLSSPEVVQRPSVSVVSSATSPTRNVEPIPQASSSSSRSFALPALDDVEQVTSDLPAEEISQDHANTQAETDSSGKKPTKWGRCECGRAFSPHTYKSGAKAGRMVLLCNGFWSKRKRCWKDQPLPPHAKHFIPKWQLEQHRGIQMALKRGAVQK